MLAMKREHDMNLCEMQKGYEDNNLEVSNSIKESHAKDIQMIQSTAKESLKLVRLEAEVALQEVGYLN
jgi:hypothetical protein